MLFLQKLSVFQFKNYNNRSFDFTQPIVGICGNNGVGKTNLLDAIHYLCFTKSYFSRTDTGSIQQGYNGFRIEGKFLLEDKEETATCIMRETGRKEFSINGNLYERFSKHIGHYPCVIIAPDDSLLVTGTSEERRKFLDGILSQLDNEYLQQLISYSKILQQRNSLLRHFAETGNRDLQLLDVLDGQLEEPGTWLFNKRKQFMITFLPLVRKIYGEIAGKDENISLIYESELLTSAFTELLINNRQKDQYIQRTASGPHRDDIDILLNDQPFKAVASQGQRKSLLFALKLSEMEVLEKEKGFPPLLLLDDIFEKLDESRISNLLQEVCVDNKGQVFITDTNKERLIAHLDGFGVKYDLIELL